MRLETQQGPLSFAFDEDSGEMSSHIRLEAWAGFRSEDHPRVPDDADVRVVLEPGDSQISNFDDLTSAYAGAVRWLLANEVTLRSVALNSILSFVRKLRSVNAIDDDELDEVVATDDLRHLIGLSLIRVYPYVKSGLPFLGFEWECDWDPEHGCGVLMHGHDPVEVGVSEVAQALDLVESHGGRLVDPAAAPEPVVQPAGVRRSQASAATSVPSAVAGAKMSKPVKPASVQTRSENPVLAYCEWLQAANTYWRKNLLPGDANPRKTSGLNGFDLTPECADFFKFLGGQRSDKQFALPGDGGTGFALLTVAGCGDSRDNEIGFNYLMHASGGGTVYQCDQGVAEGKWRKKWYPIAQRALKWGWTKLFLDYEPLSGAPSGRLICQSFKSNDGQCVYLRTVVAESIRDYFGALVRLADQGRLCYEEKRGVCIASDDAEALALVGMNRGHFELGKHE